MNYLILVDCQNDFVSGSLGTAAARGVMPNIVKKIEQARKNHDIVFYTMDTHNEDYHATQEGRNLPVAHCIKDTWGWELHQDIKKALNCYPSKCKVLKYSFGAPQLLPSMWKYAQLFGMPNKIEVVGLCTDVCVIVNTMLIKSEFHEREISVDASCCAGTTKENHINALNAMKQCQIKIVNEDKEDN